MIKDIFKPTAGPDPIFEKLRWLEPLGRGTIDDSQETKLLNISFDKGVLDIVKIDKITVKIGTANLIDWPKWNI